MILEYDAASNPVNGLDFVHLLEVIQNGFDRILHAIMKEVLQALLVRDRPLGNPVSKTGQEVPGLEESRIGGKRVVEYTRSDSLLL
jgi:hypothetical protein